MKLQTPAAFFSGLTHLFPRGLSEAQVTGISGIICAIPEAMGAQQAAYCLATAYWETAQKMQPIEEYGLGRNYPYGKVDPVTHQAYYGRGYVQLTWKANYAKATSLLRERGVISNMVDLVAYPANALRPDIAAAIMVYGMTEGWFTGRKLSDYFSDKAADALHARQIINGMDHASDIAGFFMVFLAALRAAGVEPLMPIQPPVAPIADPKPSLEERVAALEADVKALLGAQKP